jgi:hypothetical protein
MFKRLTNGVRGMFKVLAATAQLLPLDSYNFNVSNINSWECLGAGMMFFSYNFG